MTTLIFWLALIFAAYWVLLDSSRIGDAARTLVWLGLLCWISAYMISELVHLLV
jgi:hypothetical protein